MPPADSRVPSEWSEPSDPLNQILFDRPVSSSSCLERSIHGKYLHWSFDRLLDQSVVMLFTTHLSLLPEEDLFDEFVDRGSLLRSQEM